MANSIVAGNSTNGGTAISTDTSGTLNIVTGSGSGATAVTVDGSGNVVITGTITASGGVSGGIRSGTAIASTSGTSIDFTSLPTGIKRITVMFSGVSTNGTSLMQIQIGSGSVTTSGYLGTAGIYPTQSGVAFTSGFGLDQTGAAASVRHSLYTICLLGSNAYVGSGVFTYSNAAVVGQSSGSVTLGGALDRVRITTVNGTDTFDAGTINILFE
jgi:hypothetical protein